MSADGVITGRRPYRFLDETSAWNGAVRLSAFVILPLLCLVGGILMISYETGWANHEDRDSRDMAWDYRVTAPGSNNFHGAYFRRAHWNTFRAIEAPATVYTEVVLAAVDRPTMLALHPTGACERTVQVACLASKPAHRAASAGPLNLGTDDGSWAVGDGRVLTRSSTGTTLEAVGTTEPAAYTTHAELASFYDTRYAELDEMRQRVCVGCNAAPLVCDADATGKSCSWDSTQWAQWAQNSWTNLGNTKTCETSVNVCDQVEAAIELAAKDDDVAGRIAARVVTGSWTADNVHTKHLASATAPTVQFVTTDPSTNKLAAGDTPAAWTPLTDTSTCGACGYVDPATALTFAKATAALNGGAAVSGYLVPPDADGKYRGLRGGVAVGGVYADLQATHEVGDEWRIRKGFVPAFYEAGFWPWEPQCDGTSSNVTVAVDPGTYVPNFPAFDARGVETPFVNVTVLGTYRVVEAYESACDFDGAGVGADAASVTCRVAALSGVDVAVAYTPVAGEDLGAWRVTSVTASYGSDGGDDDVFVGTEAAAVAKFTGGVTRSVKVTLRDAGGPETSSFPPLGTPGKIYAAMAFFLAALFTAPIQPYLMFSYVHYNVAVNEGKPPPGWQAMRRFRGW